MISKKNKLTSERLLSLKSGKPVKNVKNAYFSLKIFTSTGTNPRFSVIVSTKVDKRSVVRNHIKRIIFGFLSAKLTEIPLYDYIFIVYPAAAKIDKEQLLRELEITFLNPKP